MIRDMPSSEEMIRRAKETLVLAKEDFLPKVEEEAAARGMPMRDLSAMVDEMPDEMMADAASQVMMERRRVMQQVAQSQRERRVDSSTPDHLVVRSRDETPPSEFYPAAAPNDGGSSGSRSWARIVGNILLIFVAVTWVLLLIGLIDNPDDLGSTIGGGVVVTIVPFIAGILLRRAGKPKGIAV